jgi:uncharacterized protein YndB with AHSA1/START domain
MARFSTTATSPRPASLVFDYLADMRNAPDWDPGVAVATIDGPASSSPVGEGTTFDVTLRLFGRLRHVPYRISAYDRPHQVVLEGTDPTFRSLDTVTIELSPDGSTTATYTAELEPAGIWRLAAPAIALAFQGIGRRAATGLARELSR